MMQTIRNASLTRPLALGAGGVAAATLALGAAASAQNPAEPDQAEPKKVQDEPIVVNGETLGEPVAAKTMAGPSIVDFKSTNAAGEDSTWSVTVDTSEKDVVVALVYRDDEFLYSIETVGSPGGTVVTLETAEGAASVDKATIDKSDEFWQLASGVQSDAEVALNGVAIAQGQAAQNVAQDCADGCRDGFPVPADCDGAIDEFNCCINEAQYDVCRRACECEFKPWYQQIGCGAAAGVAFDIDVAACVLSLPIPG